MHEDQCKSPNNELENLDEDFPENSEELQITINNISNINLEQDIEEDEEEEKDGGLPLDLNLITRVPKKEPLRTAETPDMLSEIKVRLPLSILNKKKFMLKILFFVKKNCLIVRYYSEKGVNYFEIHTVEYGFRVFRRYREFETLHEEMKNLLLPNYVFFDSILPPKGNLKNQDLDVRKEACIFLLSLNLF